MSKCDFRAKCANFKPKETRKQTGWICRDAGCGHRRLCLRLIAPGWDETPNRCPIKGFTASEWTPFYGKVVG